MPTLAELLGVDRTGTTDGPMLRVIRRAYRKLRGRMGGGPRPAKSDFALAVPFGFQPAQRHDQKVAVILHLYYVELADEIFGYLANIPRPCDVLVTVDTESKRDIVKNAAASWDRGQVKVKVFPNRGRDIAPKLMAFSSYYEDYDLLLFLHSKRTVSSEYGDTWREQLYGALCGCPLTVASILKLFESDPSLGLVYPQVYEPIRKYMRWAGMERPARKLAQGLGLELNPAGTLEFPVGSMFWARPQAMKPLLDLDLKLGDFPAEAGQTHGTIAHAIERMFTVACESSGMGWCKVARPELYELKETILPVNDVESIFSTRNIAKFSAMQAMIKSRIE